MAEIDLAKKRLTVGKVQAPFELLPDEKVLTLHAYLDRSILEVYLNGRDVRDGPARGETRGGAGADGVCRRRHVRGWQARELTAGK